MKWLIYLLLIFNIGFAAWHYRGTGSEPSTAGDIAISNENQLVLLSEYRQRKKMPAEAAQLCYSLGPFVNRAEADKAENTLKAAGISIKKVKLRDTSRQGYWVLLPPTESRKEAQKSISHLKRLKVKDFFLVATGAKKNAVSLGVYSQKNLARRRVDEMIRLGFVPRLETVALPRKVYWLNWYKDASEQPKPGLLQKLHKQFPQTSRTERSCK